MAHQQTYAKKSESNPKISLNYTCPSQKQRFFMPLTLTQLYLNDQASNLTSKKTHRAREDKEKQRCWTDEEHLKLCQIFNSRGLVWHDMIRQFQKRQKAEIKQHLSLSLRKIFQQLTFFKRNDLPSETSKQDFRFFELRRMVKYISSDRHRSEQFSLKIRKVVRNLLATQVPSANKKCTCQVQQLQELKQALIYFKKLMEQKSNLRQIKNSLEKALFDDPLEMELGYQSDFQSAFSQNLLRNSIKQNINVPRQNQNDQSENRSLQFINQNVIVQDQDNIKALLNRQGLLIYTNQSNQQIEQFGMGEVGSDCDMLDNDSHQKFCSCHFIQDDQNESRGQNGRRVLLCGMSSEQQD